MSGIPWLVPVCTAHKMIAVESVYEHSHDELDHREPKLS